MINHPRGNNDPIYAPQPLSDEARKLRQLHLSLARFHNRLTEITAAITGPGQTEDDFAAFHIATNDNPCEECGRICFTWNVCFHCGRFICQACYDLYHPCLYLLDTVPYETLKRALAQGPDYLRALRAKNELPRLF